MATTDTKVRDFSFDGYVIPEASTISTRVLLAVDRCDARECGAAARVRAVKNGSELVFCAHHGRKNVKSLVEQGWFIDNQIGDLR